MAPISIYVYLLFPLFFYARGESCMYVSFVASIAFASIRYGRIRHGVLLPVNIWNGIPWRKSGGRGFRVRCCAFIYVLMALCRYTFCDRAVR